jgi:5'-nucleotidase/UDP-sugar diphosphatase
VKRSHCFFFLFVFFLIPSSLFSETVVFLHSNDTHGIYKPYKIKTAEGERWVGGMEACCHYINAIREKEEHVFYIDTGDIMTGTLATELEYKGVTGGYMIEFLNRLKCDIWCFGNHEFDLGLENALGLSRLAEFPTIMANIVYKKTGKRIPVKSSHTFHVKKLRVGVMAVMQEAFVVEVLKERIEELDVLPVVSTLRSEIPELDNKTDLIVVIYHGRFPDAVKIAENVQGIDIILVASEDGRFKVVNGTLVQSTFGHQKSLGYLKVEVEKDRVKDYTHQQIWLWDDGYLNPSPHIKALVKKVDEAIGMEYAKVIGRAERDHLKGQAFGENVLGNWITDAMRWKTGAEIGFQNTGGIRNDIAAGPITKGDIFEVSPFRNTLVVFKLTGQEIKDLLEHDIEKGWDRLQVSGIRYVFYAKDLKPEGERVLSVDINGDELVKEGKVLHPDKVYTIVSNNYLVGQAEEKYFGFPVKEFKDTGVFINQVLIGWLEEHELLDYHIEGRIRQVKK